MTTNRIAPFIALLLALGFVFVYIKPTFDGQIAATQQQITGFDSAIAAANRFNEKDAELTTTSSRIPGASLDRLTTFLPDSVDNIQLILDLNGLAARSGMTLGNFNVNDSRTLATSTAAKTLSANPTDAANPLDSLTITLSATGTYQSFRVFLGALESSLRPLDIESVTIQDSKTGVYTYALTLRIYWLH